MTKAAARLRPGVARGFVIGSAAGIAAGWLVLALGGHTDASGRMGIVVGTAVFALIATGWRQGRRAWQRGAINALLLGGAMLAHYWLRLGRLP